jgi:hypothetical protein
VTTPRRAHPTWPGGHLLRPEWLGIASRTSARPDTRYHAEFSIIDAINTVGKLIAALQDYAFDTPIRLATQPGWPFEYTLGGIALSPDDAEGNGTEPTDNPVVWIWPTSVPTSTPTTPAHRSDCDFAHPDGWRYRPHADRGTCWWTWVMWWRAVTVACVTAPHQLDVEGLPPLSALWAGPPSE